MAIKLYRDDELSDLQAVPKRATARAIAAGKKAESEAEETDRFTTLDGAFRCLLDDFRVEGIAAPEPDQGRLL